MFKLLLKNKISYLSKIFKIFYFKSGKGGFLTIELMISLAIITMVLSAVVMVSFTNQNFLIDSQTNNEALKIAQGLLEEQQALARKDFNLVNPTIIPIQENIYTKKIEVNLLPDFLTKKVKAIIFWKGVKIFNKSLEMTTLVSNFDSPVGGNTCDSTLIGDWLNPEIINNETNFAELIGDSLNTYMLSDVDVYKNILYVTASKSQDPADPSNKNLSTFFIFDITEKEDPNLLGQIDNASNTIEGLNNIHVSEDPASNPIETYAYVTNAYNCDPISPSCDGQFYIIDVTDPDSPNISSKIKILSSPAITQTNGTSIFYKNNYIFLGLAKNDGPEFHMIDVHNPKDINNSAYSVGNFEIDNGVNDIYVKNNYVYLASASQNNNELQILDISNPSNIISVNHFDDGSERGKSLYLVGDRLYFGKTKSVINDDNFYIFDISDSKNSLPEIGSFGDLSQSINDIIIRSNLGFFLTNSALEIFNVGDPLSIDPLTIDSSLTSLSLPTFSVSPISEPSMDCEGNYLYVISNDNSGNGHLSIITSS